MKSFFLSVLLCCSLNLFAQDTIPAENSNIIIYPILHGSLAIQNEELKIFVDPYGGAELFQAMGEADLIFITDIHGDHLHKSTLEGLNTANSTFIVPQAVADQLGDIPRAGMVVLNNGEHTTIGNIQIKAIPMYNLPESDDSRHPKGRGNGYVLTIDGKTIYLSGDTEGIPEMHQLKGIDIAFVCMNLPYTMDVDQAASAVLGFKPAIVYPYHYRGKDGLSDVQKFKSLVHTGDSKIEVRLRNWYPNQ